METPTALFFVTKTQILVGDGLDVDLRLPSFWPHDAEASADERLGSVRHHP